MSVSIVGISGNPSPGSKTLALTGDVVARLSASFDTPAETQIIDLAELAPTLLTWGDQASERARDAVRAAALIVVATPVYKGSYTGLLKVFLDGFDLAELPGALAVPLTIAASPGHALAGPTHLEPVLAELGLLSPGGTLHVPEAVAADPLLRAVHIDTWLQPRLALLATAQAGVAR